ncbi:hypothetical protein GJAV_G00227290 [Gymnothorax javanicus]|nr:hypothetical protein GJAV_G00227290 [Gymnothorax javanicus]
MQPANPRQALVRRLSLINLENFRRQYARRRWKMSFRIVTLCNHLTRLMKKGHPNLQGERDCASDHEEEPPLPVLQSHCCANARHKRLQRRPSHVSSLLTELRLLVHPVGIQGNCVDSLSPRIPECVSAAGRDGFRGAGGTVEAIDSLWTDGA